MINGELIMKLRLAEPGLTQYKLATRIGLIQCQIAGVESGKNKRPQVCMVIRLANYFNVTVDELLIKDSSCCE